MIIALTVTAFSAATIWHLRSAVEREAQKQISFTKHLYHEDIHGEVRQISALLELITNDEAIRRALRQRDRKKLLKLAAPYYEPLNSDLHITHFYFTGPDRINLLRIHNPNRHGDRIERYTTLNAERSGRIAYGLELGVLGTFTLRVVKPWFHKGELLGYVELGEEIDHVVEKLRETLNINLFVFIKKEHLDREKWEKGMQMLDRMNDWERYSRYILVNMPSSSGPIPARLEQQLSNNEPITLNNTFDIDLPTAYYKATFLPLEDVRGEEVGMMLLMSPQQHWLVHGRDTILGAAFLFLLIGSGVFVLFYRLADQTEKAMDDTAQRLLLEAKENEMLHTQHIEDLEERNRLLEEASAEVQINRNRLEEAQRIAHIGSWEWDIASGGLNWSDEVYRIFGYRPGEIEATYPAFLQAIHPDDRQSVVQAVQKSLDSGMPYEIEHRIVRPNGEERIVRELGELYCNDKHDPERMIGIVHDITTRKRAEQLNRQLGHIFDNASNEIYLIAADDLHIIQANHTAVRRLDYTLQELFELSYLKIAQDLSSERFQELAEPLASGESREIRFEALHRCRDGENYPVEIRLQQSDLDKRKIYIAIVLDISERMQQEIALRHQAMHDSLTDMPNRLMLGEQLQHEISRAQRKQYPLTLVHLNINDFGAINDTLGHDNGDKLLQQIAKRLKHSVRQVDMVARIGGDEFAVLKPDSGMDELEALQTHMLSSLSHPYRIDNYSLTIEATLGIAVYPDHADSAKELLQHADVALKRAKAFTSLSEVYRPDFDPFSVRRLVLNSHMRSAIEKREFELYFQPKVTATSGTVHEAEALLRWHHPEHGLISPTEFIPLAEKTGYIKQITLWVIEETVRQLSVWRKEGLEPLVSINLSARNLLDPELLPYIADITEKYRIPPRQLGFEVTETTVMLDPEYTQGLLLELNQLGHPIAIDDYGTGYSSLAYIHRLPADELKIDSSFILDMLSNDDSLLIVHSTVELAHNLNMRVTAEGVETAEQAEALKKMGADLLQGFYFGKPVPAEAFVSHLKRVG